MIKRDKRFVFPQKFQYVKDIYELYDITYMINSVLFMSGRTVFFRKVEQFLLLR